MLRLTISAAANATWMSIESLRLGPIPRSERTPDSFVCLEEDDMPVLRIDLYESNDEHYIFTDAIIWSTFVAIGWGNCAYIIDFQTKHVQLIPLGSYYGHMYPSGDRLLIASAEQLHCVCPDGSVSWRSDVLGIDGVVVDEIAGDVICGQGEWDPPGGWRTFKIHRSTGKLAP
jgi:hypothetical protein